MAHCRLYDIFVILIFVTTGKLHCYRFSFFLNVILNERKKECKLTAHYEHLHATAGQFN